MSQLRTTDDLSLAALMLALGGTIELVRAEDARGCVTVDVTRVRAAKIIDACEVLVEQLQRLPDQPSFEQLEQVVHNTILGQTFDHRDILRTRILKLRKK